MTFDNETYNLNQGFSNATNSPPPADLAQRAMWEQNTRLAAMHDSSNIPAGYYDGIPINMPESSSGVSISFSWSELSGPQRRDAIIALVIAVLFAVGLCIAEKKPMTSVWDAVAVFVISVIVFTFCYFILRAFSILLSLIRKLLK